MDPLTAVLIGSAVTGGVEAATRDKPEVKQVSSLNPQQRFIQSIIFSNLLGIDPDILYGKGKRTVDVNGQEVELQGSGPAAIGRQLVRSGALNERLGDLLPDPESQVYQGQRVAGLTDTQNSLLAGAAGIGQTIDAAPDLSSLKGRLAEIVNRRTSDPQVQIVGESGPEVITANRDVRVLPNEAIAQALAGANMTGKLVNEENQADTTPEALRKKRGDLMGLETGGEIQKDKKAIVGEAGPEAVVKGETTAAISRALSGQPTTRVDSAATEQYINEAIAAPARQNFAENTSQVINSAFAGPGYFGSARARAQIKGAQDVERDITAQGAQVRYQDEQARRALAESAANRSLSAVPTALNVQNNPLLQSLTAAQIASQQFATGRGQALLPGEIATQQGNVEAQKFATERGRALLPGEVDTQQSNIARQDVETVRRAELTPYEVESQRQGIISQQLGNYTNSLKIAGVEQAQNQNEINAEMQKFFEENEAAMALFNQFMSFFGQSTTDTLVTGGPGGGGAVGNIFAAGLLAGD